MMIKSLKMQQLGKGSYLLHLALLLNLALPEFLQQD